MTKKIRRANERGHADHGWLDSFHTFSFADYHDPRHMGFRALRVINEDRVAPGKGFGTHGHRDMEIISYPLSGALEHKDSTGTGSVIHHGDVQRMSAGTGVMHSEYNASKTEKVHFLQIWIMPNKRGFGPSYEERHFAPEEKAGKLRLIAAPGGAEDSLSIQADARVYAGELGQGQSQTVTLAKGRGVWVHVARGSVEVAGEKLSAGDAIAIEDEAEVTLTGVDKGEVLLFDLA
jgi:redox-sensitive bicupin YhaK (pirin superfamily)